jgi:ankyrin repeat protein
MSAQDAIDAGADVNYSHDNKTCLAVASYQGHAKMVALLLNAGADKEAKTEDGFTALLVAIQNGHENGHALCVEHLLNAGADPNAKSNVGDTALLMAAQADKAECIKLLLKSGADTKNVDTKNLQGSTALMAAASQGHLQCVKYLTGAGCDANSLNRHDSTALLMVVFNNHVDCVRVLVKAGADTTIKFEGRSLDFIIDHTNKNDELKAALRRPAGKRRCCEHCDKTTTGQKMMKCGACLTVYYCNRACQKANWPLHKQVCTANED